VHCRLVPGDKIPSGKQHEDILEELRRQLYVKLKKVEGGKAEALDSDDDTASSAPCNDAVGRALEVVVPDSYVPCEMLLFCWHGPPSGDCITAFNLRTSEGPSKKARTNDISSCNISSSSSAESPESLEGEAAWSDSSALSRAAVISQKHSRSELRSLNKQQKSMKAATPLEEVVQQTSTKLAELTSVMTTAAAKQEARAARKQRISELEMMVKYSEGADREHAVRELRDFVLNTTTVQPLALTPVRVQIPRYVYIVRQALAYADHVLCACTVCDCVHYCRHMQLHPWQLHHCHCCGHPYSQ
jgi:hypothetical protein